MMLLYDLVPVDSRGWSEGWLCLCPTTS